jgi:stage II sporulation protein M
MQAGQILKKHYSIEWGFFKKRLFPIFVILLFISVAAAFVSYSVFKTHPDKAKAGISKLKDKFEKGGFFKTKNVKLCIKIFANNFISVLVTIILSFIPFLFFPVWSLLVNSIALGLVSAGVNLFVKTNQLTVLAAILPHGIFEIPGFLYGASLGILLTLETTKKCFPKRRVNTMPFWELVESVARSLALVIVPLLIVAAIIETFITPLIVNLVGGLSFTV